MKHFLEIWYGLQFIMLKGEKLFSPQSITLKLRQQQQEWFMKKKEQKRKKISVKTCEWMNEHLGFQEGTPWQ